MQARLDNKKTFAWPVRIYYEDTDSGGVVYYANYFKFAERARTELLRSHEINQESLRHTLGYSFVVRRCQVEYILPARLDDELIVFTQITSISAVSMDFYQEIKREAALIAQLTTQIVCLGVNGRPQRIPTQIRQIFAARPNLLKTTTEKSPG